MNAPPTLDAILRRDRVVVILVLVAAIGMSWLYVLFGAGTGMLPHEMASFVPGRIGADSGMVGEPASWTLGYALVMISMWWLMMIAMMLPSAAPMVLLHGAIARKDLERTDIIGPSPVSRRLLPATLSFIAGYLVMWGAFSLVAVIAQWTLERAELLSAMMVSKSSVLGACLLLGAGLWQLTPLKTVCLRFCRAPIHFLSMHWRGGVGGAFAMGLKHGVFCLGCCWFLMGLLFFGGVMNLFWIVGLALFILVEKLMPAGVAFGRVSGVVLVAWGVWLGARAF